MDGIFFSDHVFFWLMKWSLMSAQMGRKANKKVEYTDAALIDDKVRAGIIQEAIRRAGLHAHTVKREKVENAVPVAHTAEILPAVQLPRFSTVAAQAATEDPSSCVLPWPVEQFAAQLQSSTQEEPALSPLETEAAWLREALALSAQREESLQEHCKALRIQLHKAYRMIALYHLNGFSCDTEMPTFPETFINIDKQ